MAPGTETSEELAPSSNIAVGVAGWSYPDWEGFVYTPGIKDKLRFIASYVDLIEINSTFYRPPSAKNANSWVERTNDFPGFFFTAKLHQDITHRGRIDSQMVSAFREGLHPMVNAGRLRHLLAQFRYDFSDTPQTRDHLARIHENFGDITNLTFELRHNTWQSPHALEFLGSLGTSVANLDYPTARDSFNLQHCTVGEHAYLRLHGRNNQAWFSKAGRNETYNYLYSKDEIASIAGRAVRIAELSKSLTLVANNHYRGKEAVNALELRAKISGEKVRIPPQLLTRYPHLKEIAKDNE